ERHQEGMGVGVAGRRPTPSWRDGGQKLGRVVIKGRRHEGEIAQWLNRRDENNKVISFGISYRSGGAGGGKVRAIWLRIFRSPWLSGDVH
ncbi:MAG TPA: hypothetical protein VKI44_24065, partial [Acetobacteraceae bacterium]|nr:hypothetical protein [Acetobacteraceae bacterium]